MKDVVIPPVPSSRKKELEEGFLKTSDELRAQKLAFSEEKSFERTIEEHQVHHDHHHEETTHKIIRSTCLMALLVWVLLLMLLATITFSNPFSVLVGLSPILLTIIVTYILVDKYHLESGFLMVFPFIFTGIFLMLGLGGLLEGIDYKTLSVVNIIFGLFFEAVLTAHYGLLKHHHKRKSEEKIVEKKTVFKLDSEEDVKKFISTIEDKCKAINASIGRVYSVKHGGTDNLRKKIRIDPSHYNEFNEISKQKPEFRKNLAISLVRNIKHALNRLSLSEREIFTEFELKNLSGMDREAHGHDKIINILIRNDNDPVKSYYEGAMEFCEEALSQLEKK